MRFSTAGACAFSSKFPYNVSLSLIETFRADFDPTLSVVWSSYTIPLSLSLSGQSLNWIEPLAWRGTTRVVRETVRYKLYKRGRIRRPSTGKRRSLFTGLINVSEIQSKVASSAPKTFGLIPLFAPVRILARKTHTISTRASRLNVLTKLSTNPCACHQDNWTRKGPRTVGHGCLWYQGMFLAVSSKLISNRR